MRTTRMLLVTVGATVAILSASAMASTVSVDPSRDTAVFRSGPGASDVTSVEGSGPAPFYPSTPFTDAAQPLKAGAGCLAGVPVWCHADNQDVRLGAGDDRFTGYSNGSHRGDGR